jgi:hypothetical protein
LIYFIHPNDDSTEFLSEIYRKLAQIVDPASFQVLRFSTNQQPAILRLIPTLAEDSLIVYMGHGTADKLYGIHPNEFVLINSMSIFDTMNLFAIACDSTFLLRNCFSRVNLKKCIGFGKLPTEIEEIDSIKQLRDRVIGEEDIEEFKSCIVQIITKALAITIRNDGDLCLLYSQLRLLTNVAINEAAFEKKNQNLAELLYCMSADLTLLQSY